MSRKKLGAALSMGLMVEALVTLSAAGAQEAEGDAVPVLAPIQVEATIGRDADAGAADRAGSIVIDREDLQRRNPQSIRDVFSGDAAVSVGGGHRVAQKVYVNGIEETNLAVTVDGARQNRKIFHHTGTNLLDPSLLRAVRVDRGVAPADAGPGALGGTIVYETVDVDDLLPSGRNLGAFVTGSYATNGDTITSGAATYGRAAGFEALGFFRFGDGDDYDAGNGDRMRGTGTDFRSFLLKGAYESLGGHHLELSAERIHDEADRPFRANIGSIEGLPNPVVREYELTRQNYVLSYELTQPEGLFDPKVLLAFNETETKVPEPFGSDGSGGGISGKVENRFAFARSASLTAGVDFYDEHADYKDPATSKLSEEATNVGLYAQARLEPFETVGLSFGLRGDRQWFEGVDGSDVANNGLSGNASATWDIAPFLRLRGGYSNVWGGIALQEPYIFNPDWSYAGIEPVRAETVTAGVELVYWGFSLSADIFRTDFDDARDASFGAGPYLPFDYRSKGYALGAGYSWGDGFVRLSYIDSEITSDGAPVDSDTLTYFGAPLGRLLALEAAHAFAGTGIRVGGTIEAAFKNNDLRELGLQGQEAYEVVNLYAEYQPPFAELLTLRLDATNLFDETYADRATYGQEFGTVRPLYEPGRSFLVSAKVTF